MKGTKALSFLLAFAMLVSLVIPGTLAQLAKADDAESGLQVKKNADYNEEDGTYTITLEAYATGEQIITEVKEDVPADIILVLDQSGSMDETMTSYGFRPYTNKTNGDYYELRHNYSWNQYWNEHNLYYPTGNGGYAQVSVERIASETETRYEKMDPSTPNYTYHLNGNNLYVKVGEDYQKVECKIDWGYKYTFPDGFTYNGGLNPTSSPGKFDGKGPIYIKREATAGYTYIYSYTDSSGTRQEIGTSDGENTDPQFNPPLYEMYTGGTTKRVDALKAAAGTFINNVKAKAKGTDGVLGTGDDVHHRIAVVGFASRSGNGNNTELLSIEGSNSGSVGVAYNDIDNQDLLDVLQDMTEQSGQDMVTSAIGALATNGATEADLGLEMAKRILNANPVPADEERMRVVLFFTDGSPTSSNGFEMGVANDAIAEAGAIKNLGAEVYAVGIFEGADATNAGSSSGDVTQKSNWFMQNVSSNNGVVSNPSFYLSASNAGTLNNIFWQISNNIESGGSSTTLDSTAVVRDFISDQFELPEGTDVNQITLKTYEYKGNSNWTDNNNTLGASARIEGNQVIVTGFDFSEHWCGTVDNNGTTSYRGNKLQISFKVQPKAGFLGGNGVYTNGSAGVYENENGPLIAAFNRPTVDVPIKKVSVDPADINIYLQQDVPLSDLKANITVGDVSLKLGEDNYGLAGWQTQYVDIEVVITDKGGNTIPATGLTGLTDDNSYTVSVTVSPKPETEGTATAQNGYGTGNIYVYKPVLTYKDSSVYYGDSVPTDFSGNLASTSWQHNGAAADAETMGAAPALSFQYTPGTGVVNDTIATKQDIPVDVTVKIGEVDVTDYVTFLHQACTDRTETLPADKEFLLHVKTCQLTIIKSGGDSSEPYVFTVLKDGEKYTEVTVMGNNSETIYELPFGTYSIQEDIGWSWRYTSTTDGPATLNSTTTSGTITCSNTQAKSFWLNGFSNVMQNIFNKAG